MYTMILFFCVLTSITFAQADEDDILTQFLKKNVNSSISPCDNFYRHVCPKDITDQQTLTYNLGNIFTKMQLPEYEYFAGKYPAIAKLSTDFKLRLLDQFPQNVYNQDKAYYVYLPSKLWKTLSWQRIISQSKWMQHIMDTQKELFDELLEEQIKVLKESKWVANYVGIKIMENKLRTLKLYTYNVSEIVWEESINYIHSVETKLEECYKRYPNVKCYFDAIDLDDNTTLSKSISTGGINIDLSQFNGNLRFGTVNIQLPVLYAGSFKNKAHTYGILGAIMSHEIGHAVGTKGSTFLPYITNATGCIVKHMRKVCQLQDEVSSEQCLSGEATLSEDVTDSPSFKNTINVFKRKYEPDDNQMKEFFYAMATTLCLPYKDKHKLYYDPSTGRLVPAVHSLPGIRINAELMLLQEFQDAFKCKAGDFMTTAQEDKCHLYGREAGETKNFVNY